MLSLWFKWPWKKSPLNHHGLQRSAGKNWAIQPGHFATEPSHPRQKVFKTAMDGEETDPVMAFCLKNWLWRIYVHKPISIYLLIYYISYIYIVNLYIYTHTQNTHMFIDPYPRFQSKSHVDSSAPTGLPRARVPSQRPWKWVEETRSSHLGINGLPKPWWTSLELELFLVAKASKRERFRGQILIPNKVL